MANLPNPLVKKRKVTQRHVIEDHYTLLGEEEFVVVNDFNFEDKGEVLSWYLAFYEYARPSNEFDGRNALTVRIEYANFPDGYDSSGGIEKTLLYSNEVGFSFEDKVDAGLISSNGDPTLAGTNFIIAGKPYTLPLGKYLRVTIVNKSGSTKTLRAVNFITEGLIT